MQKILLKKLLKETLKDYREGGIKKLNTVSYRATKGDAVKLAAWYNNRNYSLVKLG